MAMDYVCGIVFFDLDGTLTRGITSGQFMAKKLRNEAAFNAAEAAYERGEIDNAEVCRIDAAAWKRHKPAEVHAWLDELPLVDGIADVVAWCRQRAIAPYITSCAWNFIGNHIADRFDFEGCCGPVLEERAGMFSGRVAADFDENDKRIWAEGLCEKLYLEPAECAAVGNSRSDLPLFSYVSCPIGFNATPEANRAARFHATGTDLRAVLPHLQRWQRGE